VSAVDIDYIIRAVGLSFMAIAVFLFLYSENF
jgi:hypothetical protein